MMIAYRMFSQKNLDTVELDEVIDCTNKILLFLNKDEILDKINQANQPRNSSGMVQKAFIK